MTPEPRILIVIFAFNEGVKLRRAVDRLARARPTLPPRCDVAIMDDGSTDGQPETLAAANGFQLIRHNLNSGVGAAVRSVIRYCREHGYEATAWVAGNDKDNPDELARLLDPILSGVADFVQGSRYAPGGEFGNMPAYRQVATRFIHPFLMRLVTGFRFTDSTNGFRAMRLGIFDDDRIDLHQPWLDAYEMEPYIVFKVVSLGYRLVEVPCTKIYPPASEGYTKMKPFTGWWSILRPLLILGLGLKR